VTQRVWDRPHTTWVTNSPCSGLRLRGFTHPGSARSPCPVCPSELQPHEMTSSGVIATVWAPLQAAVYEREAGGELFVRPYLSLPGVGTPPKMHLGGGGTHIPSLFSPASWDPRLIAQIIQFWLLLRNQLLLKWQ